MLRQSEPKPVSEKVWDGLQQHFGFVPIPPNKESEPGQTEKVSQTTPHEAELAKMLERVLDQNDALVKRLDTQGALLTALWDAVRGNAAVLGEVREALAQLNEEQP